LIFFKYFFWEYPSGAGSKFPPRSKEPWGLNAPESDYPHREPGGLGRGFLSLAKLALVTQNYIQSPKFLSFNASFPEAKLQ
jgi:hypothetical protein